MELFRKTFFYYAKALKHLTTNDEILAAYEDVMGVGEEVEQDTYHLPLD